MVCLPLLFGLWVVFFFVIPLPRLHLYGTSFPPLHVSLLLKRKQLQLLLPVGRSFFFPFSSFPLPRHLQLLLTALLQVTFRIPFFALHVIPSPLPPPYCDSNQLSHFSPNNAVFKPSSVGKVGVLLFFFLRQSQGNLPFFPLQLRTSA